MIHVLLLMVLIGGSACVLESQPAQAGPDAPSAETPQKSSRRQKKKTRSQGLRRARSGKAKALNRRRPDVALSSTALPKELAYVGNLLAQRAFRAILTLTHQRLAKAPTNSNLHAARIVGCRHYGEYLCVDQSYDEALATSAFDLLREVASADAHRHQGAPLAAARIRRALVVEHARPHREMTTLSEIVYDFLAADDRNSAADVAWEAVALDPNSPDPWAMVARVSAADGDFDAAESYLWTADRLGRTTLVLELVRSEVLVAMGDAHDAVTAALRPTAVQRKSLDHTVARHQAFLAVGLHKEVLDASHDGTWRLGGEYWHPSMLGVVGEALARDGRSEPARTLADRLARTYPGSAAAQSAVETIYAHTPTVDEL